MMNRAKKLIDDLTKKNSAWEKVVERYFKEHIKPDDDTIINSFFEVLECQCDAIKNGACDIEQATNMFGVEIREQVSKFLKNRLRPFLGFSLVRKNEIEKRSQLEYLIDEIWQQRIVRRNPSYQIGEGKNEKGIASEEEVREFVVVLSAIVDHCISRILNYDGMVYVIKTQTGISEAFSEYIARKIDKDYSELRINFLIRRISNLSNDS